MAKFSENIVIIGLGFGDEGKGSATSFICSMVADPLVIRFSGGQQAGHTVVKHGIKHTFANFGSGTLNGAPTYWSYFCTFDPVGFINEYRDLKKKLKGNLPKFYLDLRCPVTTPIEKNITKKGDYKVNGTCGVGVGSTWQREEDHYHLSVSDLLNPTVLEIKLDLLKKKYFRHSYKHEFDEFLSAVEELKSLTFLEFVDDSKDWYEYDRFVYEGSQGLLLDQEIGFFPHVTRSNTGLKNVLELMKSMDPRTNWLSTIFCTRAYQTRHGNGPMTNEDKTDHILPNEHEINVTNKFQGEFRKGMLDLDLLKYGYNALLRKTNHTLGFEHLFLSCVDCVKEYSYTLNKEVHKFDSPLSMAENIRKELGFMKNSLKIISSGPDQKDITVYNQ